MQEYGRNQMGKTMDDVIVDWERGWQAALDAIRAALSPASFNTLFANARAEGCADGVLTIGTANRFVKSYIEGNHRAILEEAVSAAFGRPTAVRVVVSPELYRERVKHCAAADDAVPALPLPPPAPRPQPLFSRSGASFANFVAGRCNEFALAAARQAAQSPGEFSPLVLYGGHGRGKTHLLHALCRAVSEARPGARVICQTAEAFVRDFSAAVLDKRLVAFRERYDACELLAIDDFHVLGEGSKLATQKEFAQVLEQAAQRGAQVVLTSAFAPNAIDNLCPSLQSRLRQGLAARLDEPDEATRLALVMAKASDLRLPPEAAAFLAGAVRGDVREVEGALNRLRLRLSLAPAAVTPELLGELLETAAPSADRLPVADVLAAVAFVYNVSVADVTGKRRQQSVAQARRAAAHLCRRLTAGSLAEIGAWLGGRTHATVLSLLRRPPFAPDDPLSRQKFAAVLARLGVALRPADFVAVQAPLFE